MASAHDPDMAQASYIVTAVQNRVRSYKLSPLTWP